MAGRRVKRLRLAPREFNGIVYNAGGASNHILSAYMRGATHVEDLCVIDVARNGDAVEVFVESSTFPELSCCYKSSAPEWLVTFGERSA